LRRRFASSSSVYGANTRLPFSVHDNVDHPISLYAATKKANELMAHAYSRLYGLPATGLRFFTVYGPWGRPDMAMFIFTKAILEGRPISLFNHGQMRRDFTYVDDTCRGFLAIAGLEDGEIYHIGSDEEISVGDLFKLIAEIMKSDAEIEVDSGRKRPQESEVLRLRCNSQKLRDASGFHSDVRLREGLRRTIDWFRDPKNLRRYKQYLYNV